VSESSLSVLAESADLGGEVLATERVLDEFAAALRAEVETNLLANSFVNLVVVRIIQAFKNVLDLLKMIVIIVVAVSGVHRGEDFDLDYITKIMLRIEIPLTKIARVPNHSPAPSCITGCGQMA
jgi:hypothetical protein